MRSQLFYLDLDFYFLKFPSNKNLLSESLVSPFIFCKKFGSSIVCEFIKVELNSPILLKSNDLSFP